MEIKPIRTESDYQAALERLNQLFDAPIGTAESDEFERQHYPVEDSNHRQNISFLIEKASGKVPVYPHTLPASSYMLPLPR
jgi:HTH-type transcriptional regulator/antitoxin HigA